MSLTRAQNRSWDRQYLSLSLGQRAYARNADFPIIAIQTYKTHVLHVRYHPIFYYTAAVARGLMVLCDALFLSPSSTVLADI